MGAGVTGVSGQGLGCFQTGKTRFLFGAQLFRFFEGVEKIEKIEKLLALSYRKKVHQSAAGSACRLQATIYLLPEQMHLYAYLQKSRYTNATSRACTACGVKDI